MSASSASASASAAGLAVGLEAPGRGRGRAPPGADGTEPVAARANLSTPAQDNFAAIGERPKGAKTGRRGPVNPTMACCRRGCPNQVKRPDRKFCCSRCAFLARETKRYCEVCGKELTPTQRAGGKQLTCSRYCGNQIADRSLEHDEAFREHVRRAWCEEHKTDTEIGNELGCSKNVIVGVRRRMGLPKRPSGRWPADYVPKEQRPTMAARKRPPPARKRPQRRKPRPPGAPKIETRHGTSVVKSRLANALVREASPIRVRNVPGNGCQYPVSENPWRICDDPRVSPPDKLALSAYCQCHYELCFNSVPMKRSSEDYLARVAA